MILVDAQLSPAIAKWIEETFQTDCKALRDLGLRDSQDEDIFLYAKTHDCIVLTKDIDFVILVQRLGSPPKVILLTCGNTSNARLKEILSANFQRALELLYGNEIIVEITD